MRERRGLRLGSPLRWRVWPGTSAADALVIVFEALAHDEQDEVLERFSERHLARLAGDDSVWTPSGPFPS